MKTLINFFKKLAKYFTSEKAKKDLDTVLDFVEVAIPYIAIAEDILASTGVIPPGVDAVWDLAVEKFPTLFDGMEKTKEERSVLVLGMAAEALKSKYPKLDTTLARTVLQTAYVDYRSKE